LSQDCDIQCWDESIVCETTNCPQLPPNYPDWQENPIGYENTATMTAIVLLEGQHIGDAGDLLAGFDVAGNVRGMAVKLYPPFGPYEGTPVYEMQIHGDDNGDLIHFQYYDISQDTVYEIIYTYTFIAEKITGDAVAPHVLYIKSLINISIELVKGWNWFSIHAEADDMSLNNVFSTLTSTEGDFIKSQTAGAAGYYEEFGWYGSLDNIDITSMYKMDLSNSGVLEFTGYPADPLSTPISLINGWNWVGYPLQYELGLDTLLLNLNNLGVAVISQSDGFALYYGENFGWFGTLYSLKPTKGYQISVSESIDFYYPQIQHTPISRTPLQLVVPEGWDVNPHNYAYIGNVTISVNEFNVSSENILGAFIDGECRGYTNGIPFPFNNDNYIYMIQIYSNETDGEELTFKYYDSQNDEVVEYSETLIFTNNMIVGNGFNPLLLDRLDLDENQKNNYPTKYNLITPYPNPFNPTTTISFSIPEFRLTTITAYDLAGKKLETLTNEVLSIGDYSINWDASSYPSGVYLIRMDSGDFTQTQKVVLVK